MKPKYFQALCLYWTIGWSILLIGRIVLYALFIPYETIAQSNGYITIGLYNSLRFDFQTLAYISILPLIAMITASFFKTDNWLSTACRYYYAVTYTILIFLEIVAIGFYKNFGCNLNIVLFDFFDENPGSLINASSG